MKQGNRQEIEQGLTEEEYIMVHPSRDLKQGMNVWIPLEINKPSKETIQQVRKRDMAKYFLEGFFGAF